MILDHPPGESFATDATACKPEPAVTRRRSWCKITTEALKDALIASTGCLAPAGKILGCTGERVRQLVNERGLRAFVLAFRALRKQTPAEARAVERRCTKERLVRYRAAGLCGCGRERAHGKVKCPACGERDKKARSRRYHERAERGECVRCGKSSPDTRYCAGCLDVMRVYQGLAPKGGAQ